MVNPISSSPAVYTSAAPTSQPQPRPSSANAPQDSVHLSAQALSQAGGDADHDGDSH